MEQSRPTKLPFIARHMYFYVHVNTRANNSQCEWIYFTHVGKNRPPHDRNHWHNSQLPRLCINLTTNSNMSWCYCRNILHKCEKWRKSDVWEGSGLEGLTMNQNCPMPSSCVATLVTALSKGGKISLSVLSRGNSGGSQGQSWRKPIQHCCFFLLCWLKRVYCACWPLRFHFELFFILDSSDAVSADYFSKKAL